LTYDGQSLRATKEFGNCAEDGDLVKTSGYPAFILSRMGTTSGFRYDFDGRTVREKPISGK
jgi:hypothetical protein